MMEGEQTSETSCFFNTEISNWPCYVPLGAGTCVNSGGTATANATWPKTAIESIVGP